MRGGSLQKELHEAGVMMFASAFVQRRSRLPAEVMEEVLERFNAQCQDKRTYKVITGVMRGYFKHTTKK